MIIPVRCFTCGKPIGQLWEAYGQRVAKGESPGKVMDSMGLERYCCRRMLLTHADLSDELLLYTR
jgi:DNA-directed RNA polymerase subunit N